MVKVSVLYPNGAGTKFDMAYYVRKHIPMVQQLLGSSLKRVAVEQGISGMQPRLGRNLRRHGTPVIRFTGRISGGLHMRRRLSEMSRITRTPSR